MWQVQHFRRRHTFASADYVTGASLAQVASSRRTYTRSLGSQFPTGFIDSQLLARLPKIAQVFARDVCLDDAGYVGAPVLSGGAAGVREAGFSNLATMKDGYPS